ncbi:acryloyl-CoA reductase [Corynebacterium timonense]|uniref:Putative quinone oxidoreductase, YhdH/YhfP family n=1 Tax=Corynebacterium timonense TaxID=441500 RepID=A0A1H1UPE7_9CORY|nr:acryloyl-CoA reductase [Corynebacterium timonense]SDS74365.1 putative quinone oxidoreductase, YhdH/YhfP family [Corynebacterium timonense]
MTQRTLIVTDNGPETIDTAPEHAGEGDTLIEVSHSSVNYKDAMALDGNRAVLRTLPTVPGIDAVGRVVSSPSLPEGTLVTVNGFGIGEHRHGGYTPQLRIDASRITRVPSRFDAPTAAAIGTAGYTAALSVAALERALYPLDTLEAAERGPVLVTGATGGVGSIAVQLLSDRGFTVHALTGRVAEHGDWLRSLGASEVVDRAELSEPGKPLQKARYGAVVDALGGVPLANAVSQVTWGGVVTACGRAAGVDLPASVVPFILRGVQLIGVNSVDTPVALRKVAWDLLAESLDVDKLSVRTVSVEGAIDVGRELLAGTGHGRTVVEI